jgi:hypothetical protein
MLATPLPALCPQDAKLPEAEEAPAASKASKESAEAYDERMRRAAEEKADFLARQAEYRLNAMQPHERCLSSPNAPDSGPQPISPTCSP